MANENHDEAKFRIGSVSRLTGIPTDTLRIWERRYEVVNPIRGNAGVRLYTHSDISRLTLIKQLVDQGNAIGTVARLSQAELEGQLTFKPAEQPRKMSKPVAVKCNIVVCGDALPLYVKNHTAVLDHIYLVGEFENPYTIQQDLSAIEADILIMEYPSFQEDDVNLIKTLLRKNPGIHALIVYGFATRQALQLLANLNVTTIRAPIDIYRLKRECQKAMLAYEETDWALDHNIVPEQIPHRIFSHEELAQIVNTSNTVKCECPKHLADILYGLNAFEEYSAGCEHKNQEDAVLHNYLHKTTAQARRAMEIALKRLVETEGLIQTQ